MLDNFFFVGQSQFTYLHRFAARDAELEIALYGLHREGPMMPNKQIHAFQFQILCALFEKVALKMNVTKRLNAIYKICALWLFCLKTFD